MPLMLPTVADVIKEIDDDPKYLKRVLDKDPALINIVSQTDTKHFVKYTRIREKDEKRLSKIAEDKGVAEGALIGLAIALLLAIL